MRVNKLERRLQGIKKARRVLKVWRAVNSRNNDDYYSDGGKCEQMLRKTRKPCSCYMCGNPRKRFGEVTRQEKIHTED